MARTVYMVTFFFWVYSVVAGAQNTACLSLQGDTINDITHHLTIHIDQAPYSSPHQVLGKNFSTIDDIIELDVDLNQKNTIGWMKVTFCAIQEVDEVEGFLHFGDFTRILIYSQDQDTLTLMAKRGNLYKNTNLSPDRGLYPLKLSKGQKMTLYIYVADSYPNRFSISQLNTHFIPRGMEKEFLDYSSFRLLGGFIHVGLIFLICFLIIICSFFILLHKDFRLLGFGLICTAALLYYLRDMEVYFETPIFWSYWDEGVLKVETLLRGCIAASFIYFVFTNFSFGKWHRTVCLTSLFAISLSLSLGIWHLYHIGQFAVSSPLESFLIRTDMIITLCNSLFILGLLWKQNEPFGRNIVIAILTFIAFSYSGLILNTTSIGQLDSLLSSKMYSTYGMIIFLFYIALFTFRRSYNTQREFIRQTLKAEQLEELGKAKTKLYTNITHEFRTPLTVIMGVSDSLSNADQEKSIIRRNSQQLLDLINEMLLLSKADAGSLKLSLQQSDIVGFLDYITESFLSLAEKKSIRLLLYSDEKEIIMDFDKEKVKTITTNLLSNAIRFTPIGGKIIMILAKEKNQLIWKVKDSGSGIPEKDLDRIFERFYQAESEHQPVYQGSGIGLAIVQELVTISNGHIIVESQQNQGTTFIMSFPISNNAPLSTVEVIKNNNLVSTDNKHIQQRSYRQEDTIILIVEDNDDVRNYITKSIPNTYRVVEAMNGEEGIKLAIEILPDIIVSDVMMPVKDGYELTRHIKEDERTNHIPIILLTAKATQSEKVEGLRYGADAYIIKPFDKEELLIRIEKLMHLRKKLQEKYRSEQSTERKRLPDWLTKLEATLTEHLSEEINVEWMSKKMFMSRTQLHRKLSSLLGIPAGQFIKEFKLREAKKMLLNSNDTIGTIAMNVGYKNAGHFATDFKKHYGHAPSVVRKKG